MPITRKRPLIWRARALTQLPQTNFYGRIVATSVIGEVHHYLGQLSSALPMMQRTEQMARRHGAYHYALWALLQQSEILIAQGFLQAAYEVQDKALELVQATTSRTATVA